MVPIIITLKMFHDAYETDHGDGYYPHVTNPGTMSSTFEKFILGPDPVSEIAWKQMPHSDNNKMSIDGLDGDIGSQLLTLLNQKANVSAIKIYNVYGLCIHSIKT